MKPDNDATRSNILQFYNNNNNINNNNRIYSFYDTVVVLVWNVIVQICDCEAQRMSSVKIKNEDLVFFMMKLMKWTEQVQDRLTWKDIVGKAKTVPEL